MDKTTMNVPPISPVGNIKPARSLHGIWRKDFKSSDMEALRCAMDAMKLPKMHKMAAMKLIDGISVSMDSEESATIKFLTRIPYYKITERYYLDEETSMQRRDLRSGPQRAVARKINNEEMLVDIQWDGELPGKVKERFALRSDGRLEVRGIMEIGGEQYDVMQVYNKES